MRFARLALCFALAAWIAPALADCGWEWLCNGEGECKQMPVCDSVFESPPPRPQSKPPMPPPLSMRPFRSAGSLRRELTCEHIMRRSRSGRWTWNEACYCTDKERNPDNTRPFANIVRCEDPNAPAPPPAPSRATPPAPPRR